MSTSNVIPAHQVQLIAPQLAPPAEGAPREPCASAPRITVIKDGETVRTIEIECGCGEIVRLECEY